MKFYLVTAMRDHISEIALYLHNLIALSSLRTVRGNFQGRKIQELLLVEGKSTRKEHGDGTLVPTSDVTCSNEQFLSFRTSLESGLTTMGESITNAIKDCFTTVVKN